MNMDYVEETERTALGERRKRNNITYAHYHVPAALYV